MPYSNKDNKLPYKVELNVDWVLKRIRNWNGLCLRFPKPNIKQREKQFKLVEDLEERIEDDIRNRNLVEIIMEEFDNLDYFNEVFREPFNYGNKEQNFLAGKLDQFLDEDKEWGKTAIYLEKPHIYTIFIHLIEVYMEILRKEKKNYDDLLDLPIEDIIWEIFHNIFTTRFTTISVKELVSNYNFTYKKWKSYYNIYKKNKDKKIRRLEFNYFHIWWESIYKDPTSDFVVNKLNKEYDDLFS